jgi:hypothetical protein
MKARKAIQTAQTRPGSKSASRGPTGQISAALVLAALGAPAPAKAYTVRNDPGGSVDLYAMAAALTVEPIRIMGTCESACTEYLGARDVCVSPNARFMFHAAHNLDGTRNEQGVELMLASYPPSLREWLYERGGLTSEPIDASGRDLIALGLPPCE